MGRQRSIHSESQTLYRRARDLTVPVLLVVILAVLPFNRVYHFNSQYAYVDGYFVNYLDFVVHVVDVAMALLLIWLMVEENVFSRKKVLVVVGVVLVLASVHGLIFNDPVVWYGLVRLVLYIVTMICFISYLSIEKNEAYKRKFHEIIMWAIGIGAAIQSALGFLQFTSGGMLGLSFLGESQIQVGGYNTSSVAIMDNVYMRAYGTFPHPNILGGFLVVALLIIVWTLPYLNLAKRILAYVLAGVILAGVGVTFSRVAWVVGAVLVIFGVIRMAWLFWRQGAMYIMTAVGVLVTGGVLFILAGNHPGSVAIRDRLINQSTSSDMSVVQRVELAERATDTIREHPLLGVGMSSFIPSLAEDPVFDANGIRVMQPVHNVFLLILAETGIVGMLAIGVGIVLWSRIPKVSPEVIVGALVLLSLGVFDHYLWSLPQGLAIATVVVIWVRVCEYRML